MATIDFIFGLIAGAILGVIFGALAIVLAIRYIKSKYNNHGKEEK